MLKSSKILPKMQAVALTGILALSFSGCGGKFVTQPIASNHLPSIKQSGLVYYLPKTVLKLSLPFAVYKIQVAQKAIPQLRTINGWFNQPAIWVTHDLYILQIASDITMEVQTKPDRTNMFFIQTDRMPAFMADTKFDLSFTKDGTVQALNADLQDKSAEVVTSLLTTGINVAKLIATHGASALLPSGRSPASLQVDENSRIAYLNQFKYTVIKDPVSTQNLVTYSDDWEQQVGADGKIFQTLNTNQRTYLINSVASQLARKLSQDSQSPTYDVLVKQLTESLPQLRFMLPIFHSMPLPQNGAEYNGILFRVPEEGKVTVELYQPDVIFNSFYNTDINTKMALSKIKADYAVIPASAAIVFYGNQTFAQGSQWRFLEISTSPFRNRSYQIEFDDSTGVVKKFVYNNTSQALKSAKMLESISGSMSTIQKDITDAKTSLLESQIKFTQQLEALLKEQQALKQQLEDAKKNKAEP